MLEEKQEEEWKAGVVVLLTPVFSPTFGREIVRKAN